MAQDSRFRQAWRSLRHALARRPAGVLAAGVVWTVFAPVVYGLWREGHSFQANMLPAGLWVAAILFLLGWAHAGLYLLAALGVGLLNAIFTHVAHFWRIGDLPIRIETALDTSPGESREFLRVFVLQSKFAWALMGYVAVALALGVLFARARGRAPRGRRHWAWRGAALLAALALVPVAWGRWQEYPAVRLAVTTYQVYTRVNPILERKDRVAAFLAQAPPLDCDAPYDHIVFVLGESANRDFMSLYGYPQPTTPFLDALPDKVVVRAISPVNQTMTSVPIILTPATVQNYEVFYTSPSVVADLRRCGYQVFWLSNQLRYSPYTSSVSSIASEADVVRFVLDDLEGGKFGQPDEVLLRLFAADEVVPGRKQAFFIHLLGSHFDWKDRYPPDKALIPQPRDLREVYANTIHYTDQVLAQLFARFRERSQNLLFIYTSDHGEWITANEGGHAFSHAFQDEYRIPLVFWATDPARLTPIAQATQGRLVNTETLDLQLRFLVGLRGDPGISYSTQVLSLGPGRIREYLDLPYLLHPDTP